MTRNSANSRRPGGEAFSLIEILLVVGILAILSIVAIPNYVKGRTSAQNSTCIRNLKIIEHAVQEWAFARSKSATDTYSLTDPEILAYFKGSVLPVCPGGGTYSAASEIMGLPTCSISGHTL